jgi:ribosomal protein L28
MAAKATGFLIANSMQRAERTRRAFRPNALQHRTFLPCLRGLDATHAGHATPQK